jgi:signal transduction histidine kinase
LSSAWRWLGLEGAVLLAALLCDLLIVFPAAFDQYGPRGRDLVLLPGIFAMVACALWARRQSAAAIFAGAAVLIASTALIRLTDASAYSTVLSDLSLTETVAGLELVFFCVRRVRPGVAFVATSSLVLAALFAAAFRSETAYRSGRFDRTLMVGVVLLIGAVAVGVWFRRTTRPRHQGPIADLLRSQWPLIGALCLPLFLELYQALDRGPRVFPLLLCSIATALLAVLAARSPVLAAVLAAGTIVLSGIAFRLTPGSYNLPLDALPLTEVFAGVVIVVFLVRYARPPQAWGAIGLLSTAVGIAAVSNLSYSGSRFSDLRSLFVSALLMLGISVAIGLYFRARDSERTQVVEAAVTEAQTSERMALARELHDVVAHHVTGIVVQAQAAKMVGGKNPELAMDALGRIEEAGTEALVAMRRLVRSMRSNVEGIEEATTDLDADLRRLAETAHHGVPTELDLRISPDIPQEVARSALRLVQESLTNVGKHAAAASRVVVLAEVVELELHIRVSDDGRKRDPRPAGGSGGYGLVGMRERVELLRGRLHAGPADGGWVVEAWLPLEGDAE